MNTLKHIRNVLLIYGVLVLLYAISAFAQGGGIIVPANPDFNLIFLLPVFLGWFPHWLIKYAANRTTTPSIKEYLLTNLAGTFTGFITTFGMVYTMFQTNPAAFASVNVGSILMVLMTAWGADTLNSNISARTIPLDKQQ